MSDRQVPRAMSEFDDTPVQTKQIGSGPGYRPGVTIARYRRTNPEHPREVPSMRAAALHAAGLEFAGGADPFLTVDLPVLRAVLAVEAGR